MDNATLLHQKVSGFSLIMGAVLLVISTFLWKGPEVGIAGGLLQVFSCVFWILGLLGLLALLRPTMPGMAAWMSIVATFACIGGNNWGMDGIYFETYAQLGASVTHKGLYEVMGPAALLTLQLPGLLFPITLIVIGIALYRSGKAPAWCGIMLALGGLGFPISRIPRIEMIAHLADLLILIPAVVMGLRMIRSEAGEGVEMALAGNSAR